MKIIHTADWHLGKLIQGVYMTEDQAWVLGQFIQAIAEEKPDVVIIAGDIYDRAVPPTEAVELLNRTLEQIVLQQKVPMLAIAGNHDSPDRLEFGTNILAGQGLHIAGRFKKEMEPIILEDDFGEVHFHLIPYADPAIVRNVLGDDSIRSHDEAMEAIINILTKKMDKQARHVFVGHAFVTPHGEKRDNTSEAERPLSIGGAEYVQAEHFRRFHYTALGHLHEAHHVMHEQIRYAGSLLKYSVSEANHHKGYTVVHMDGDGDVVIEKKRLKPRRDLRRIEAKIAEIETHAPSADYVFVSLLDENPVLFPMEKVRAVYPNALHVERKPLVTQDAADAKTTEAKPRHKLDPAMLFASFYEEVKGQPIKQAQTKLFVDAWDALKSEEAR